VTRVGRAPASSYALLALVLLAGAALRLRGLDWGLPFALHIDERLFVAEKAIELERSLADGGLPDPGITSYGILPLWLLVAARAVLLGAITNPGPPAYNDPFAATILLARAISAIAGIASIAVVWAWARRFGARTGLVAAALVAGFPALVQSSHFGTVESLLVLGIAGGMLAGERLAEQPTVRRALVAGVVWGAALSVKSPAAFLALPLVQAGPRRFPIVAGAALAVVLALNPGLAAAPFAPARGAAAPNEAPEHTTFLGNIERAYSSDFHDWTLAYANEIPVVSELTKVLPWGIGPLALACAGVGIAMTARRRTPADIRLLLLAVPLLLVVFPARVKTIRFMLPAFPALAVLAARGAPGPVFGAVLAAATLVQGAALSSIYVREDARVAAARWIDEHVGPRETIVVEDPPGYGPPFDSPSREIPRAPLRYEILWRNFYTVHERRSNEERRAHLDEMLAKADWLALSEGHRAEFTAAPKLRPVESAFYADLDAGRLPFRKVESFKTYPQVGTLVVNDDGAEILMRVFDHPRIDIWRKVAPDSGSTDPAAGATAANDAPAGSPPADSSLPR
jgi:hypothetical protein